MKEFLDESSPLKALVRSLYDDYVALKISEIELPSRLQEVNLPVGVDNYIAQLIVMDAMKEAVGSGALTVPEAIEKLVNVGMDKSEADDVVADLIGDGKVNSSVLYKNIMWYSSVSFQKVFSMSKIKIEKCLSGEKYA